ncbi:LysR family transcriptional regulator [Sporolactobacillus sp. KGMB 08714]|uniref:LysR family transcriptional regulator n=1 Tax=Sporolactobacillus sp. KGMB 08714 TaxID=3064704 RepID=UPI002FBD6B62
MQLRQLEYFQVVARLENMTRAAEELHVAQSSLSKMMSRLEEEVGVPLFERYGRKRFRLNRSGRRFSERIRQSFTELEQGLREAKDIAGIEEGRVIIGATTSRMLPKLFEHYLAQHPRVKFRLYQMTQQSEIQEQLLDGTIDLCLSSLPIQQTKIHCEPLIDEEIFLALPPGHRLSGRSGIQLAEVANEPFIHLTSECGLREITNEFCRQAGFSPNIAFESNTAEVICSLVKAGLGNAFIPEYWWNGPNTESLERLHISNPVCRRTIWLSWVKDRYLSAATRDFKTYLISELKPIRNRK